MCGEVCFMSGDGACRGVLQLSRDVGERRVDKAIGRRVGGNEGLMAGIAYDIEA